MKQSNVCIFDEFRYCSLSFARSFRILFLFIDSDANFTSIPILFSSSKKSTRGLTVECCSVWDSALTSSKWILSNAWSRYWTSYSSSISNGSRFLCRSSRCRTTAPNLSKILSTREIASSSGDANSEESDETSSESLSWKKSKRVLLNKSAFEIFWGTYSISSALGIVTPPYFSSSENSNDIPSLPIEKQIWSNHFSVFPFALFSEESLNLLPVFWL